MEFNPVEGRDGELKDIEQKLESVRSEVSKAIDMLGEEVLVVAEV